MNLGVQPRTRVSALIVAVALFMQNLDSTVIATALPTMARAFGADPLHMNVALTSYLISLAVFIPASGWVADRFGTRAVFRAAIAVFTLGSVMCGAADTLWFLVLSRVVQGLGGAMMVPVGRLVLLRSVPKSELVAAMAWLTLPALLGPVLGPPLGGLIITYASWRWIFYINVPIGGAAMLLVTLFIADVRDPSPGPFDGVGLLLSGIALAAAVFGLETSGRALLPHWVPALVLATSGCAAAAYLRHARRHPRPLLDLSLFRVPSFAVSVVGGTLFRIGVGAVPFLLPLMMQLGFGKSAAQSGAITFASSAGAMAMKPAARVVLRWLGFRDALVWNGLLSAAFLGVCGFFRPAWPVAAIYAALLLGGFIRSLQFTAYNTLAYADIARSRMSAATSLYSTLQQVSLTLGISIGAGVLEAAVSLQGRVAPTLPDFNVAFATVALLAAAASPLSLLMPRNAGSEVSGKLHDPGVSPVEAKRRAGP